MEEFLAHEDIWIFAILGIIVINTLIIVYVVNKESRKTDAMYEFIKKLLKK